MAQHLLGEQDEAGVEADGGLLINPGEKQQQGDQAQAQGLTIEGVTGGQCHNGVLGKGG